MASCAECKKQVVSGLAIHSECYEELKTLRTFITEWCAHCKNEVAMEWDVEMYGYEAYCPYCGKRLMICSECLGSGNACDYNDGTNTCRLNREGE